MADQIFWQFGHNFDADITTITFIKYSSFQRGSMARKKTKRVNRNKTVSIRLSSRSFSPSRWDPFALGYSWAVLFGLWILVVSVMGKYGQFPGYIQYIQTFFPVYSLSVTGIILGVAACALGGLLFGLVSAWLYNKFL